MKYEISCTGTYGNLWKPSLRAPKDEKGYVHAHTRGFQHLNPYIGYMHASFTRHPCPAVDGYPQHATGPLLYRNRKRSSNSKMYYRVLELLADAQYTQRERWSHSGRSFGVQAGVIVRVLLCVCYCACGLCGLAGCAIHASRLWIMPLAYVGFKWPIRSPLTLPPQLMSKCGCTRWFLRSPVSCTVALFCTPPL